MIAFTAISLGLVYVGSCKINIARAIISVLENRQSELEEHNTRFLCLAIGLLYLGKKVITFFFLFLYAILEFSSLAYFVYSNGSENPNAHRIR